MPIERVSSVKPELDRSTSSATEYRERYMSPRREDYIPPVVIPKVGSARPPTNRNFLSFDADPSKSFNSSEYRLCFPNHHPKRPYVFHAQPSHVFDYVPHPPSGKPSSRLSASMTSLKDTEYQDRFPNYRSYIPGRELMPAHLRPQPNIPSETQVKRDRMARSQYFHHLVSDDDRLHGGQRHVGSSEQRAAFQWPYQNPYAFSSPSQLQASSTVKVYPPYFVPRNIYEPMPTINRHVVNSMN